MRVVTEVWSGDPPRRGRGAEDGLRVLPGAPAAPASPSLPGAGKAAGNGWWEPTTAQVCLGGSWLWLRDEVSAPFALQEGCSGCLKDAPGVRRDAGGLDSWKTTQESDFRAVNVC